MHPEETDEHALGTGALGVLEVFEEVADYPSCCVIDVTGELAERAQGRRAAEDVVQGERTQIEHEQNVVRRLVLRK